MTCPTGACAEKRRTQRGSTGRAWSPAEGLAMMNLNLITSVDRIGYGYVGRFVLKELMRAGVQVALFPLSYSLSVSDDPQDPIRRGCRQCRDVRPARAERPDRAGAGRWRSTSAAASTSGFPSLSSIDWTPGEIHHLKQLDAILVCSKWAAGVVASSGVSVPIVVAPLGVDRSVFHETIGDGPAPRATPRTGPDGFREQRQMGVAQGPRLSVAGVLQCLHAERQLRAEVIEPQLPPLGRRPTTRGRMCSSTRVLARKVQLVPRVATQRDVAALLAECDCGVFPSRAEGWNLGLLECMSVGLNVIATNYSAPYRIRRCCQLPAGAGRRDRAAASRRLRSGHRKLGQAGPVPDGADGPSPARSAPAETGGLAAPQRRRNRDRQTVHLAPYCRIGAAGGGIRGE